MLETILKKKQKKVLKVRLKEKTIREKQIRLENQRKL